MLPRPGCFNDVERRPTTSLRRRNNDELPRLSRGPKNELRALNRLRGVFRSPPIPFSFVVSIVFFSFFFRDGCFA